MSGREERDIITDSKTLKTIVGQPEILMEYFNWLKPKTAATRRVFVARVKAYLTWLKENGFDPYDYRSFSKIKARDIENYINQMNLKPKTANEIIVTMRNFHKFLLIRDYVDINVADKIEKNTVSEEPKITYLTNEEIAIVKNNILNNSRNPERDIAIFAIGYRTGLRVSAIIDINIEDIDFHEGIIKVTEKGNVTREVYPGENTMRLIKYYLDVRPDCDTDALFITGNDYNYHRITRDVIATMLKNMTKELGKNFTPHKMRSTFATELYAESGDIYLVADAMGHKNIANTRKYAKVTEKRRREAAALMNAI